MSILTKYKQRKVRQSIERAKQDKARLNAERTRQRILREELKTKKALEKTRRENARLRQQLKSDRDVLGSIKRGIVKFGKAVDRHYNPKPKRRTTRRRR